MKNLVKMGILRLFKNMFYILGCILAFGITVWFLDTRPIPQFAHYSAENVAIILSAVIILFFALFVGFFIGSENEDGILRNKVMAGHTQLDVYLSHYIVLLVALLIMQACWFCGALVGGAKINLSFLVYLMIAYLANAAFVAAILAIAFRLKKQSVGIVVGVSIFYALSGMVLTGNYIYAVTYENPLVNKIVVVLYNMSPIGQCFARTSLCDPGLAITGVQITVSFVVMAVALLLGTLRLNKRDIN